MICSLYNFCSLFFKFSNSFVHSSTPWESRKPKILQNFFGNINLWINALLSFGLIFRFTAPLSAIPRQGWVWLTGGSALLGTQSVIFVSTLAVYGKATSANIVYASRGLLSVLLVWMIGHWFMNQEQHLGAKVLRWRLLGAALMLSAIVLVVA